MLISAERLEVDNIPGLSVSSAVTHSSVPNRTVPSQPASLGSSCLPKQSRTEALPSHQVLRHPLCSPGMPGPVTHLSSLSPANLPAVGTAHRPSSPALRGERAGLPSSAVLPERCQTETEMERDSKGGEVRGVRLTSRDSQRGTGRGHRGHLCVPSWAGSTGNHLEVGKVMGGA